MDIAKNIEIIKEKIKAAAIDVGRNPAEIKLVAVTKTKPAEMIEEALKNGVEIIGENKVQEAYEKIPQLRGKFKEFHFIGHLQSNKINKLLELEPSLIHSIDNIKTAEKLNNALKKRNKIQNILVQVNTSGEESKFGIKPNETYEICKKLSEFSNLKILGLMTIGKLTDNKKEIEKCFETLQFLFNDLKSEYKDFKYLSMGMSGDFEIAIKYGANMVRIGSAIFGRRN